MFTELIVIAIAYLLIAGGVYLYMRHQGETRRDARSIALSWPVTLFVIIMRLIR